MIEAVDKKPAYKPSLTALKDTDPLVKSVIDAIVQDKILYIGTPVKGSNFETLTTNELINFETTRHEIVCRPSSTTSGDLAVVRFLHAGRIKKKLDEVADEDLRRRYRCVVAVLLLQLSWPVASISEAVGVSRQALTPRMHDNLDKPLTTTEIDFLNEISRDRTSPTYGWGDYGSEYQKYNRTGLEWNKVHVLPTPSAATVMQALWRLAWRARGDKSVSDAAYCSKVLDMYLGTMLARGVTGFNLAQMLQVQHAAIFQRIRNIDYGVEMRKEAQAAPHLMDNSLGRYKYTANVDHPATRGMYLLRSTLTDNGSLVLSTLTDSLGIAQIDLARASQKRYLVDSILPNHSIPGTWTSDTLVPVDTYFAQASHGYHERTRREAFYFIPETGFSSVYITQNAPQHIKSHVRNMDKISTMTPWFSDYFDKTLDLPQVLKGEAKTMFAKSRVLERCFTEPYSILEEYDAPARRK
ncbi:hypothetical protein SEA_GODONK_62 [Gordonia phage GodonK]|uniref:Uncharacterized protein n=1 Tax=Gordonia phage GodonK TaxID=2562192 RepID=A0A4D6E2E0_9CAUD|nr:hypothetical protein HOV33_gp062 [Gordonia phage GodonK]QBZ72681.1 hypothetical protein SEA_GODONK_62 [Gordonia phage GodonK]